MGSFVHIVPFALFVNYATQNFIPYHWRFLANAFFGVNGNLLCLWRCSVESLQRILGPISLRIKSRTQAEIADSIAAELIQILNQE